MKDEYYWITTSYQGCYSKSTIKSSNNVKEKDLKNYIWFKKDEKDKADEYRDKLQKIYDEYALNYPERIECSPKD